MQSVRPRRTGFSRRCVHLLAVVSALGFVSVALLRPVGVAPSEQEQPPPSAARGQLVGQLRGPLAADHPAVIQELRDTYLVPPSHNSYQVNDMVHYHIFSTMFLWNVSSQLFIQDRQVPVTGAFFVEAGAMDGVFGSNTLELEMKYNWKGLLIEPSNKMFKSLLTRQRKAWAANICLSTHPYPFEAVLRKLSVSTDHIKTFATVDVNLMSMTSLVEDTPTDRDHMGDVTFQAAQCFPVYSVLLALNVTRVTLFSLDVEDVELPILEQFPFQSVFVDVWMVEHRRAQKKEDTGDTVLDGKYDPSFVEWFESRGYQLFAYREAHVVDYVFVHKQSPYSNITFKPIA